MTADHYHSATLRNLLGLTTRFPSLALDGEVTWNGRINLRGPAHLPISVSQEPAHAS